MSLRNKISLTIALWALLETLAFTGIAALIGVGGAILLGIASTILGASLAKRLGRSAVADLRRGFDSGLVVTRTAPLDGLLAAMAAVLLILPGFLTDAAGLLLAIPVLRDAAARSLRRYGSAKFGGGEPEPAHGPSTIDLDPHDWHATQTPRGVIPKA